MTDSNDSNPLGSARGIRAMEAACKWALLGPSNVAATASARCRGGKDEAAVAGTTGASRAGAVGNSGW